MTTTMVIMTDRSVMNGKIFGCRKVFFLSKNWRTKNAKFEAKTFPSILGKFWGLN